CWQYDWYLEFDIKGLFDNIPHDLLLRAVDKHCADKWVRLSIRRWLTAPVQMPDGTLKERNKGTPQGGVISPVLANLFLHYVFDKWLSLLYPEIPWCRYADDGLIHCGSKQQAEELLNKLAKPFQECGLELHPEKTKIVYCKDSERQANHETVQFNFLGYTFRARRARNQRRGNLFTSFSLAVSNSAQKDMIGKLRKLRLRRRVEMSLEDIAKRLNPMISGWLNYYAKYYKSAMKKVCRYINLTLIAWARKKYKTLRYKKTKACQLMERLSKEKLELFAHWKAGPGSAFA
ncbi:group II intron reverse transcriptase/maturase, partial [Escherichia coli]|nr:group II intron reverse transcriptase/maturase [Escherichia coli]